MKIDIKSRLKYVLDYLSEMNSEFYAIYSDKGIKPFKKSLIFSLPIFLIAYFLLYKPSSNQINVYRRDLKFLETLSTYYNEYSSAKQTLLAYKNKLPLYKDKDEWLNFVITSSARKMGVSIDSLSNQQELGIADFSMVSREVTVTTTYDIAGKWIAEIENSPIYIKITDLNIKKIEKNPGYVSVTFKVATVFLRTEGG